jgi:hypothetical protein
MWPKSSPEDAACTQACYDEGKEVCSFTGNTKFALNALCGIAGIALSPKVTVFCKVGSDELGSSFFCNKECVDPCDVLDGLNAQFKLLACPVMAGWCVNDCGQALADVANDVVDGAKNVVNRAGKEINNLGDSIADVFGW